MSKLKTLRKWAVLIILAGCIFSLTACDYSYYLYHNTDGKNLFLNKEVITIEMIEYKNSAVQNNPLEKHEFDLSKLIVIESLNLDSFEEFVDELMKIGGLSGKFDQVLNLPCGNGIRIIYDDDSFTLITVTTIRDSDCIFLGEYGADEKTSRTFGISWQKMIDDFKVLVNKYFETQID